MNYLHNKKITATIKDDLSHVGKILGIDENGGLILLDDKTKKEVKIYSAEKVHPLN